MPTVLKIGGYRFFFYSNEGNEPPHIHVEKSDSLAKFWLDPVELVNSYGFSAKEISRVRRLVVENQQTLINAWHEYFA